MATVDTCYTSAACNRCPYSADWGRNGLLCYGYCHAVAVYDPQNNPGSITKGRMLHTLTGHTHRVNCVRWIKNGVCDETSIISGSTDGTARFWCKKNDRYECTNVLEGHTGSVTCVVAMNLPCEEKDSGDIHETLIVTASGDSTVRIWKQSCEGIREIQVLKFGSGFALALGLYTLPGTEVPVLAIGCDDQKVHLYVPNEKDQFDKVLVLPGHEDWIRGLDFVVDDSGGLLLASCAQDNMIRVWRFVTNRENPQDKGVKSIADLSPDEEITVKEIIFDYCSKGQKVEVAVCLESVLFGHDNWVYSVRWQPFQTTDKGVHHQPMCLLSASMDKTMIVWTPDAESAIWVEKLRVGDVGGNTLGFYGGLFSPDGLSVLGHGYQGAFHQWNYSQEKCTWEPAVTGGGHFDSVTDVAWSRNGNYILSISKDQTTRLHAPFINEAQKVSPIWYEIARPQVHGYDLQCLALLSEHKFASGADEKIVRVFSSPKSFIQNFKRICKPEESEDDSEKYALLPEGANVPTLGLSNKAVFSTDEQQSKTENVSSRHGEYPESYFTPVTMSEPPSEDQLLQNTLWPEECKLYGHGYEVFSLAAHPNGNLLASACKAAKAESANILIWDVNAKKSIQSLSGCSLTIVQMAFSHTGDRLLAVSRDRTWTLFKQEENGQFVWESGVDKRTTAHARIIWACAWSHDDNYFFTTSRDKKIASWHTNSICDKPKPLSCLMLEDSVTAISLAPVTVGKGQYLVASGLDNGHILLHTWLPNTADGQQAGEWSLLSALDQSMAHHLTVSRLDFRPDEGRVGHKEDRKNNYLQLASCGMDYAVRVFTVNLSSL